MENNTSNNSNGPISSAKISASSFLFNKLESYGKYEQTSVHIVDEYSDPYRCTICKSIVFRGIHTVFTLSSGKSFDVNHVCIDCAKKANIKIINARELTELNESKKLVPIGESTTKKGKCLKCGVNDLVSVCWMKIEGFEVPVSLNLCPTCQPVVLLDKKENKKKKLLFSNA